MLIRFELFLYNAISNWLKHMVSILMFAELLKLSLPLSIQDRIGEFKLFISVAGMIKILN